MTVHLFHTHPRLSQPLPVARGWVLLGGMVAGWLLFAGLGIGLLTLVRWLA